MRYFLISILCSFSFFAFAESASKPFTLPDFSNIQKTPHHGTQVDVSMTCTFADGRIVKSDSAEYSSCLAQASQKAARYGQPPPMPGTQNTGAATGTVNFKFGD